MLKKKKERKYWSITSHTSLKLIKSQYTTSRKYQQNIPAMLIAVANLKVKHTQKRKIDRIGKTKISQQLNAFVCFFLGKYHRNLLGNVNTYSCCHGASLQLLNT